MSDLFESSEFLTGTKSDSSSSCGFSWHKPTKKEKAQWAAEASEREKAEKSLNKFLRGLDKTPGYAVGCDDEYGEFCAWKVFAYQEEAEEYLRLHHLAYPGPSGSMYISKIKIYLGEKRRKP